MQTYLMLNLLFIAVLLGLVLAARVRLSRMAVLLTLAILFVCTALFDSWIISSGIVQYHDHKLLGIYIGSAPLEDFFYALAAGIGIPVLWRYLTKRGGHVPKV